MKTIFTAALMALVLPVLAFANANPMSGHWDPVKCDGTAKYFGFAVEIKDDSVNFSRASDWFVAYLNLQIGTRFIRNMERDLQIFDPSWENAEKSIFLIHATETQWETDTPETSITDTTFSMQMVDKMLKVSMNSKTTTTLGKEAPKVTTYDQTCLYERASE